VLRSTPGLNEYIGAVNVPSSKPEGKKNNISPRSPLLGTNWAARSDAGMTPVCPRLHRYVNLCFVLDMPLAKMFAELGHINAGIPKADAGRELKSCWNT